jgi:hypothetical protein
MRSIGTFLTGVEELTGPGVFEVRTANNHTSYAVIEDTVAADVQYVDATDQFAVAYNPGNGIYVRFFDGAFRAAEGTLTVAGALVVEQPGIVSTPGRRALPSPSCGIVPLEFMRAVGLPHPSWSTWDLAYVGTDWVTSLPCDCTSAPTLNARGYNDMGDFTGDGYGDLGNHHRDTGNFWIRANWGGSFAPDGTNWGSGTTAAPPASGWETLVGDFNGDNLADYADRFTPTGAVWVHLNGGGSFGGTWSTGSTSAGANIEVLVGDLDNDNIADLLEHDRKTGQLWARKNHGAGPNAFRPPIGAALVAFRSYAGAAGQNYRLVLADFNNDGHADLAQVDVTTFQFSIYLNIGSYQFSGTAWTSGTAFNFPNFTTIFGDFNGDGWADYADVNRGNGEFWVHENLKNGAFNTGINWGHGYYSLGSGGFWIMGLPVSF